MIISVSVVIYQVGQRNAGPVDSAPVGDQAVQPPADTIPRSGGGGSRDDGLTAWASAAAAGDFVTAQQHMVDQDLLYSLWKDQHEGFVAAITGYHILGQETVGQTTTALVQFDTNDGKRPRCIEVQVNETTQQVRVERGYEPCPSQ